MKLQKLVFFFSILLIPFTGRACDCELIIGLKESELVFKGKVLSIKRFEQPYIVYQIEFRISKCIKNKSKKCNKVITVAVPSLQEGGCGVPFEIGKKYLVFTYLEDQMLYTSICTETKEIR
jgi:hypothetical protein